MLNNVHNAVNTAVFEQLTNSCIIYSLPDSLFVVYNCNIRYICLSSPTMKNDDTKLQKIN